MPAVTVITPFHNRLAWLLESVRSVLVQTFSDFELILVDDGSDASPKHILEEIDDPRVRYIRQENKGPAAARNLGVSVSKGDLIAFLDSDDLYLPDKLAKQVSLMEKHPDVALSHTSYQRIDKQGGAIDEVPSGEMSGHIYPEIISCCLITTSTVMVRADIFSEYRFDESLRIGEDILLWIKIARRGEVLGINEPLTKYRVHGENAFLDIEKQLSVHLEIIDHAFKEDQTLSVRCKAQALSSMYMHQAYLYYKKGRIIRSLIYLLTSLMYNPAVLPGIVSLGMKRLFGTAAKQSIYD